MSTCYPYWGINDKQSPGCPGAHHQTGRWGRHKINQQINIWYGRCWKKMKPERAEEWWQVRPWNAFLWRVVREATLAKVTLGPENENLMPHVVLFQMMVVLLIPSLFVDTRLYSFSYSLYSRIVYSQLWIVQLFSFSVVFSGMCFI